MYRYIYQNIYTRVSDVALCVSGNKYVCIHTEPMSDIVAQNLEIIFETLSPNQNSANGIDNEHQVIT